MKQKSIKETIVKQDHTKKISEFAATRRQLLVWSTPVIATISLPVHAQMSPVPVCATPPELRANTPAKCAGENPQGEASLGIFSTDAMVDVEIISVTDDAVDPNMIEYTATSGTVSSNSGLDLSWNGPSTDATTCLPTVDVTITITYTCDEDPMQYTVEASLLDVLSDAVP